jgi:hypothetical protein
MSESQLASNTAAAEVEPPLTVKDAAKFLGVSPQTVSNDRQDPNQASHFPRSDAGWEC